MYADYTEDVPNNMEIPPSWEDYDLHNDETFGGETIGIPFIRSNIKINYSNKL